MKMATAQAGNFVQVRKIIASQKQAFAIRTLCATRQKSAVMSAPMSASQNQVYALIHLTVKPIKHATFNPANSSPSRADATPSLIARPT
jgi:hypothetical protein